MTRVIGRGRHASEVYPEAPKPIMVIGGRTKPLQSGVLTPLLQIDILSTHDDTFAARLQFAAEFSDGTDSQIRQGDCNAAVAFKAPATFATSQAQTATNAFTAGNLTTTFSWTTVGTVATFNVTATTTLGAPVDFTLHYNVIFATHPFQFL